MSKMRKENIMDNLMKKYQESLREELQKDLSIQNVFDVPKLQKIVVSMGVKDALSDKKNIDTASETLGQITGQKPKITQAKKSVAAFKLREGDKIGVMVTLRGRRMYDFLQKLISIVLPRLRDFRGVSGRSFDGRGNYNLGFSEATVFPEIDLGKTDKIQGLEITIVTTARDNNEGEALLKKLGMPFRKDANG